MAGRRLGLDAGGELGVRVRARGLERGQRDLGQTQIGAVGLRLGDEVVQPGEKIIVGGGNEVGLGYGDAPMLFADKGTA